MYRPDYSYWLTIKAPAPDLFEELDALRKAICDDKKLSDLAIVEFHELCSPGTLRYQVDEDCGTISQTDEIYNIVQGLAEGHHDLYFFLQEINEEDHADAQSHGWYKGKQFSSYLRVEETMDEDEIWSVLADPKSALLHPLKKNLDDFMFTTELKDALKDFPTVQSALELTISELNKVINKVQEDNDKEDEITIEDSIKDQVDSNRITYEMLEDAYHRGLAKLVYSPNEDGIVCQIGEHWFYFAGLTGAQYTDPAKFAADIPEEDIISEIATTLAEFASCRDYLDEYLYYAYYLQENLPKDTDKTPMPTKDAADLYREPTGTVLKVQFSDNCYITIELTAGRTIQELVAALNEREKPNYRRVFSVMRANPYKDCMDVLYRAPSSHIVNC